MANNSRGVYCQIWRPVESIPCWTISLKMSYVCTAKDLSLALSVAISRALISISRTHSSRQNTFLEQKVRFLYYLRYCNGICLNLYLKIVQKTSHKLEIHIYSQIFENWVNFFRLKYTKIPGYL